MSNLKKNKRITTGSLTNKNDYRNYVLLDYWLDLSTLGVSLLRENTTCWLCGFNLSKGKITARYYNKQLHRNYGNIKFSFSYMCETCVSFIKELNIKDISHGNIFNERSYFYGNKNRFEIKAELICIICNQEEPDVAYVLNAESNPIIIMRHHLSYDKSCTYSYK